MKQKNKRHILFRYSLIITGILIFSFLIVVKMVRTTIIDADKWNDKAQQILSKIDDIPPERGNIYASNGTILATNLHFYTARIDWKTDGIKVETLKKYLPALCDSLQAFYPGRSSKEWNEVFMAELKKVKKNRSFKLFSNLTSSQYKRLKSFPYFKLGSNKNGLYQETSMRRIKPYGSMASRSIGRVGEVMTGGIHGFSGIEKALDSLLYGVAGKSKKIQLTNNMANWETVPAQRGYDIKTTIDVDIQDIVEEELYNMCVESEARWGTAVLMEVKTGEIKAISNLEWNDSFNDYVEGRNNAVLGYEPGSVMKPISMMMALEDGIVCDIDSVMVTGKSFAYAGGRPITDSHGAGSMPVSRVIESSSNVGMSKIILRKYEKDPGQFYHRLKQMGFFEPLHTGIAGEEIPDIDSLGTKNWDRIALTRMCYGYSTRIPPMCTLAMYNSIANGGKYVRPRLVKELLVNGVCDTVLPVSYIRKQVCSPKNATKLSKMLNDVVWGEYGTGKVLRNDKVNICGKTGTCYTIEDGGYSNQKRLAFCGFYPYENPKYSCIVLMRGANRGAARSSGIVLKNVALKLYARGLLDNSMDYKADAKTTSRGVMYATTQKSKIEQQKTTLQLKGLKGFKSPKKVDKGVPSVIGLGIREAISVLESAGLNVKFYGAGYVSGQSRVAGSGFKKGDIITLSLKQG
ncbi:MAG: penicillin-binding protein [Muribaculaceae bacterium]